MNDKDIRKILIPYLKDRYEDDKLIEEWGTLYRAVLDIAIIGNGAVTGIEIKSDRDTLNRLPNQVKQYGRICDFNYLAVSDKFLNGAHEHIPDNWGILYITEYEEVIIIREAQNNKIRLFDLVNTLWKDELISIAKERKIKGYSNKNVRQLCRLILSNLSENEAREVVCHLLRARVGWK